MVPPGSSNAKCLVIIDGELTFDLPYPPSWNVSLNGNQSITSVLVLGAAFGPDHVQFFGTITDSSKPAQIIEIKETVGPNAVAEMVFFVMKK
jgi:hypothetical protein